MPGLSATGRPLLCGLKPAGCQTRLVAGIQRAQTLWGSLREQVADAGNVQAWQAGCPTVEQRALTGNAWLLVPVQPRLPGATLHKSLSEFRPQFPHVWTK